MDLSVYVHYAPTEITKVETNSQFGQFFKPNGIYFSPKEDWLNWTINEGISPNIYTHKYSIDPACSLNIFNLSMDNIEKFCREYRRPETCLTVSCPINWEKVAEKYDGIHIPLEVVKSFANTRRWHYLVWSAYDVDTVIIWSDSLKVKYLGSVTRK